MKKFIETIGFLLGIIKPTKIEDSAPFLFDCGRDKAFYRHYTLPSGRIWSSFKLYR